MQKALIDGKHISNTASPLEVKQAIMTELSRPLRGTITELIVK
jgi:hypothetical protein